MVIFAVVEAHPSLQANENFAQLLQTLEEVEDAIQRARRYYNAVIRDYNMSIESFPRNLLAGLLGFHPRQYFSVSGEEEQHSPPVRFR